MAFRRVELPPQVPGALWLSAMPGRFETWSAFNVQARAAGLDRVVCLTPRTELAQLSPDYEAAVAQGNLPFRWMNLPMRNFGLPQEAADFRREVQDIARGLREGDAVMLHCAAGIGRTGSAAACVLKALGLGSQEALQRVKDAGSDPQSAQQEGLVDLF